MAEARVVDEEESLREAREAGGARRNPRAPTAASERADRNKPEQRQSSTQGALSSIRAVIKRTSNRTAAPADQNRERRRPEITILAAEPLAPNWFPGASGAFPPAPPPPQPSWTGSVTVQLPPPSYEQVIREKSREQNTQTSSVASSSSSSSSSLSPSSSLSSSSSSTSAPRQTTTIATQTDPENSEPQSCTRPSMRRPPKPPRPSLPLTPKPAEPVLAHTHSLIELDEHDSSCSTHTPTHPHSSEQCGVQTDFAHTVEPLTPVSAESSLITQNSSVKQEVSARPRPRPRSKVLLQPAIKKELQDQPVPKEIKVQTLVRLKDDGTDSIFAGFTDSSLDVASNKYLLDLLDVFGCEKQDFQSNQHDESGQSEKSDEEESVTFESCSVSKVASEPSEAITRPEPRPRTQHPKPPIAAKPFDPTVSVQETELSSEEQNKPSVHPVPAPRPLVKKSSVAQQQGSSEGILLRPPPRPPLTSRKSAAPTQEDAGQLVDLPFNPSGRRSPEDQDSATASPAKAVAITSSSRGRGKCPAKPPSQRRPPPPTHTPVHTPTYPPAQDAVGAVSVSKSGPSLPHQASEGRLLPLRPPPVKSSKSAGSSLTPATTNQHAGYRGVKRGPALPPRPKPGHPLYREHTSKIPQGNTKVNPIIGNPEEFYPQKEKLVVVLDDATGPTETTGFPESVKGQYQDPVTEEPIPHKSLELKKEPQTDKAQQPEAITSVRYIARFAFDGEDGELTLRDGDVITLIENVNDEWGRGSLNGRTGTFPLNFVQLVQESPERKLTPEPPAPAVCVGEGQAGRALYDFTPESEDELCLKVGDVVSSLEELDEEWFVGEFAGRRGIVPKNYIQVL